MVWKEEVWHCWIGFHCLKSPFACLWSSVLNDLDLFDKVWPLWLWSSSCSQLSLMSFWVWGSVCLCIRHMHYISCRYFFKCSLSCAAYTRASVFVKESHHPFQTLHRGCFLRTATPQQYPRKACLKHLLLMRWDFLSLYVTGGKIVKHFVGDAWIHKDYPHFMC